MLSKEAQKQKNKDFWDGFKQFMRGVSSSNGRRMNWINYPTDLKAFYLRLIVTSKGCSVNFDIQLKDNGIREIVWEQMGELKKVLNDDMPFEANWHERFFLEDGTEISRISWSTDAFNYFNEEDIPKIYQFLKERLLGFDKFYQEYKDLLIALMA